MCGKVCGKAVIAKFVLTRELAFFFYECRTAGCEGKIFEDHTVVVQGDTILDIIPTAACAASRVVKWACTRPLRM